MSSNATTGVGTKFQRWSGSAWTNIAEVNSINGPSMSRETVDVTSLDSTAGYREKKPGFRDAGQVKLSMNFTRSTYELFKTDFDSDTVQNYRIVLPDTEDSSIEFLGYVTELPLNIPTDDKITADVTIQLSGPIDMDSGESAARGLP